MTTFYNRHNGEALDYATRAFEATITKISSNGKRALRILEVGTGKLYIKSAFHRTDLYQVLGR